MAVRKQLLHESKYCKVVAVFVESRELYKRVYSRAEDGTVDTVTTIFQDGSISIIYEGDEE